MNSVCMFGVWFIIVMYLLVRLLRFVLVSVFWRWLLYVCCLFVGMFRWCVIFCMKCLCMLSVCVVVFCVFLVDSGGC